MPIIRVEADLRGFDTWARAAVKRNLPFAMAKALTRCALAAQAEVRYELPRRFQIRSTWVSRGIQIVSAKKGDYPNTRATVGSRDEFMELQETGGVKRPKKGRHIAIPSENVRTGAKGRIPAALRPRRALARRRFFKQTLTKGQRKGDVAILRRVGKDRYPLQVLYLLRKTGDVDPRFGFRESVKSAVGAVWKHTFRDALTAALQPRLKK